MAKGNLYLCATPIGNLEDMTFRAVRMLKEVDLIACEDTRRTAKLCHYFDIDTSLTSYHEHNERDKSEKLINLLLAGQNIALVSDAGTPAISDPGQHLVQAAISNSITVIPLPGASAVIAAVIGSGLSTNSFVFGGFLDRKSKNRQEHLQSLKHYPQTIIFYVSPHRFTEVIEDMQKVWGSQRKLVVARELTKVHEEFIYTNLGDPKLLGRDFSGEICVVIEGAKQVETDNVLEELPLLDHMKLYLQSGLTKKQAMKRVAQDRGVSKRDIYRDLLELEGKI